MLYAAEISPPIVFSTTATQQTRRSYAEIPASITKIPPSASSNNSKISQRDPKDPSSSRISPLLDQL